MFSKSIPLLFLIYSWLRPIILLFPDLWYCLSIFSVSICSETPFMFPYPACSSSFLLSFLPAFISSYSFLPCALLSFLNCHFYLSTSCVIQFSFPFLFSFRNNHFTNTLSIPLCNIPLFLPVISLLLSFPFLFLLFPVTNKNLSTSCLLLLL